VKHFEQVLQLARRALKRDGDLPLTAIGFDAQGKGFKLWMQPEGEDDKRHFAMACGLHFILNDVAEYHIYFTGWMVVLNEAEREELATRPSEHPRRQEVLIVYGETLSERAAKLFLIDRDAGGRLLGFKEREDLSEMVGGESQMRFSGLLPNIAHKSAPGDRERLKALAKAMPATWRVHGPEPLGQPRLN
jgi:hypothetical protein